MKYKTMTGHYTRYIPGWDTHGLPIEHAVIKNTGLNRHEMAPLDLRNKCKEYALECVETKTRLHSLWCIRRMGTPLFDIAP